MEGGIPTPEECSRALTQMRNGAPGKDGMMIEVFRQETAGQLRKKLVELVQEAWRSGSVPMARREAVNGGNPEEGGFVGHGGPPRHLTAAVADHTQQSMLGATA